ncbi:MAG: response regulator transcription factor [Bacteroidia bacterium]|nr:response regulator transcription factor [Bacteroidia bacterium]
MKIRCIILDDEQPARRLIEGYCQKLPDLEVIGSFKNPLEALPLLTRGEADLLFLDIQMPDLKGTDLLRSLQKAPQVILTTAYQEYALEGFDLNVTDYLLKPFAFDRFLQAVNKATRLIQPMAGPVPNEKEILYIKAEHKVFKVALKEIYHIEGQQEYVKYHTQNGRIMVLDSLKRLEETLPSNFMRVHRSFIVNLDFATTLSKDSLMVNGEEIPVGKSFKAALGEAFQ